MMVLASGSADGVYGLTDFATFSAITSGGYTEVTNTGYSRKTLTDAQLSAFTVDNTNNRILLTLPLQTFSTISAGDTCAYGIRRGLANRSYNAADGIHRPCRGRALSP